MRRSPALALAAALLATNCSPNPRREMPGVIAAVAASLARDGGAGLCIDRQVTRWSPADRAEANQPPPGFADLTKLATFMGGGGTGGASVGGVALGGAAGCVRLRGPVIDGDRAMATAERSSRVAAYWLRKRRGDWVVVGRTGTVGDL